MPKAIMRVTPTDFEAWRALHGEFLEALQAEATVTSEVLCRDHEDPNTIVLIQELTDPVAFTAFMNSDAVQGAIGSAPIEAPPTFVIVDEVEQTI